MNSARLVPSNDLKFNLPIILSKGERLVNWYKSSKYYKKYKDFVRLQKSWEIDINSINNSELVFSNVNFNKFSLLNQLIEYSDNLSKNYNNDDESVFILLENQFYLNITPDDLIILNASGKKKEVSLLYLCKKIIHHNLLQSVKSRLKNLKLDIKEFFRNIIQFLFKNMDDEAHSNSLFDQNLSKKRLLICLNNNKWITKREFIISKIYSKILN